MNPNIGLTSAVPTNLDYDVMNNSIEYSTLMKVKHSKSKIMNYHKSVNDPSSHKDRNDKKYTYEGAAANFAFDLESSKANDKQGHR